MHHYTLKEIHEKRFDPKRNRMRIISERYVVLNAIGKFVSPYPTYLFLNLGLTPDMITFVSIGFIIASAGFFLTEHAVIASSGLLCFLLCDSVDGDMARVRGYTRYGGIIDSYGADFFYALIPSSIGFFLYSQGTTTATFSPEVTLVIAVLVSLTFMLYRMINIKLVGFLEREGVMVKGDVFSDINSEGTFSALSAARRMVKLFRHEAVKGNFFAEPGLVLWFSIGMFVGAYTALAWYLTALLFYNLGWLAITFVRSYVTFLRVEKTPRSNF